MSSRSYHGTSFEVRSGQHTWFWFVANPHRDGGMIGAAATEAEAVREACSSIEEMPVFHRSKSITLAAIGWECSLKNLERYLTCAGGATA